MTRSMRCVQPAHGPKHKHGSVLKIPCCYSKCSSKHIDCKNRSHTLSLSALNRSLTRPLHPSAKVAHFCSAKHKALRTRRGPYGGREALSVLQVVYFFNMLRQHTPWAAALFLLALVLGERAAPWP